MGCDIHVHMEIKLNGQWEHYSIPRISRNYALFEKLAGVRGEVENAIAPPRGLPDDVTTVTKFDCSYWGLDGHSHSWISSQEFAEIYAYHETLVANKDYWYLSDIYGYLFGNDFKDFWVYREDYPKEVEDFRMIFWFDN